MSKTFRRRPCECGCDVIDMNRYKINVETEHGEREEEIYKEECERCGNLLYGFSRPAGVF